ncbi:MAG TPA: alcohol dehydrogenase [Verrucomicrobiales bacterium]|nr:alcohol dehydrogenase [Verrucomicrobiales bacterium]
MPAAACAALLLSSSPPVSAADWPQYRGPTTDGISKEKISKSWPEAGLKTLWHVPLADGFSSFTTGGGRLYTLVHRAPEGANLETLVALDAVTGHEVWSQSIGVSKFQGGGNSGTPDNSGGDGPRSTPSFADGKVYVLSLNLSLLCYDAATGKPLWSHDLVKEHGARNITWANAASPVIDGKLVFVACGAPGKSLMAFDRGSGELVWKGEDDAITHATPVVATLHGQRQVIFFTQAGLVAVEPAGGKVLWRFKFPYSTSTAASPVVSGDMVYCSAGYGMGAAAARIAKGPEGWTATELWKLAGNKICNHWSTPVAFNGHLYGIFGFKEYGSCPLKCIDIATGQEKWSQAGFGPGNVILVDGHVLVLSDRGQLSLIKPDPAGYREVGRSKAVTGKCWSTPIVSNGKVFVRSTKEGAALEIGSSSARR